MSEQPLNKLKFETNLPTGYSNKRAVGKLPENLPDPLFINLGCGNDIRTGFINIDLYSDSPEVVYMDIRQLRLPDNSVSLILANDVLMNFSHRETELILAEWNRVLKPNGEIIIRVPSLRLQAQAYLDKKWDADIASRMIFGNQTNSGDYNCSAFDPVTIKNHLNKTGFKIADIREYDSPQDKGYINLNMLVKAIKSDEKSNEQVNQENLFEGIDFDLSDEISFQDEQMHDDSQHLQMNDEMNLLEEIINIDDNALVDNPEDSEITPEVRLFTEKLNIVWEGTQFKQHSLAIINREHSYNIIKSKLANLTIVPYEKDTIEEIQDEKYQLLKQNDIRFKPDVDDSIANLPYIWIRHQWPPKATPPQGAKWIIMQPWEYSKLREDFLPVFQSADEIWTPSHYSRDSFVSSGIDSDKVQVIPNGIDPEIFKPYGDKYNLPTNKKLKLLFVGGTIWRKGFDILLDSYINRFTDSDDITLIVKDMGVDNMYKGQTSEEKVKEISNIAGMPEIIYIKENLTESEMAALYRSCDLFVSPYRGEGFSMPTLEAMASGIPVVVTKGGATDDFTNEQFAIYIDSEEYSIGDVLYGEKLVDEAYVLKPDGEHLSKILTYIYEKPNVLHSMGLIAQQYARENMTWKKATLRIFSRLDHLYNLEMGKEAQNILIDEKDTYNTLGKAEKSFAENYFEDAKVYYESIDYDKLELKDKQLVYIRLADLNIAFGDLETADRMLNKAKEIDLKSPDIEFLTAIALFRRDKKTEALETLIPVMQNWVKIKFDSYSGLNLDDLLVLTADILLDDRDIEGANQLYTEALKYNSDNPFACYGSGKCFKEAGATGEAIQMFEWAVKIRPSFDEARAELNKLKE